MSYSPRYDKGEWKAICDVCGREVKSSQLRKRWDGFMVCQEDWEPRQPQDFVRGVADIQAPPWIRDESADSFQQMNFTLQPPLTAETVIPLDVFVRIVNYNRALSDNATPTDILSFNVNKVLTDNVTSSDSFTRVFNGRLVFAESEVITDSSVSFSYASGKTINGGAINRNSLNG